ncbi:NUDIX hydrolase [Paenibacillus mesophilus]|uniref:NUDIX hydrolase n=1 Tax=Paenibacillus mesophilus TaxID=2582849 RepID=UPI00110D827E|nr:NUDIX hydrolase [Paenibacillus mesophilus]TMV49432.1 NUDIX hydrolase [Paenibacillus mesophilus]
MSSVRVQVSCIAVRDGKIAMIKKLNPAYKTYGLFIPPGGHVELTETIEEACVREMREETGLEVSGLNMVGVITFLNNQADYHSVAFLMLAREVIGTLSTTEAEKQTAHWVELDGIGSNEKVPGYHRDFLDHIFNRRGFLNARVEWLPPYNQAKWTIVDCTTETAAGIAAYINE